ncbi:MAG: TRAP transporter small permease [Clostridiales bacterium]|nr:TRAP transporter small permease [Clostridiales bacterium]
MQQLFKKIDKTAFTIAAAVAGVSFVTIVLLITMNVIARKGFNTSYAWAEEIAYICFTWMTFFGAVMVYSKRGLIAIDVLVNRLPQKGRRITQIGTEALILVTNVCLIIWGMTQVLNTNRITSNLKIPYRFVYLGMVLAFVLLGYFSVRFLIMGIKGKELDEASLEDRA